MVKLRRDECLNYSKEKRRNISAIPHIRHIGIATRIGNVANVSHIGSRRLISMVDILSGDTKYRQKLKKLLYVLFGIIAIPIWMYVFMISVKFLLGIFGYPGF